MDQLVFRITLNISTTLRMENESNYFIFNCGCEGSGMLVLRIT